MDCFADLQEQRYVVKLRWMRLSTGGLNWQMDRDAAPHTKAQW